MWPHRFSLPNPVLALLLMRNIALENTTGADWLCSQVVSVMQKGACLVPFVVWLCTNLP